MAVWFILHPFLSHRNYPESDNITCIDLSTLSSTQEDIIEPEKGQDITELFLNFHFGHDGHLWRSTVNGIQHVPPAAPPQVSDICFGMLFVDFFNVFVDWILYTFADLVCFVVCVLCAIVGFVCYRGFCTLLWILHTFVELLRFCRFCALCRFCTLL